MDDDGGDAGSSDDSIAIHPGTPLFVATLLFCVGSFISLPLLVAVGDRRAKLRRSNKEKLKNKPADIEGDNAISGASTTGDQPTGCCTKDERSEATDDLSFFRNIENAVLDNSSLDDESIKNDIAEIEDSGKSYVDIQTAFCCVGSDADSLPRPEGSENNATAPGEKMKMKRPEIISRRTSSINSIVSADSMRSTEKRRKARKKRSPKTKHRKNIKALAISRPVVGQKKLPKSTSVLDGGFYSPRKNRRHHFVLESQMKREEKRDQLRGVKYMKQPTTNASKCYRPPPLESISITLTNIDDDKKRNEDNELDTSTSFDTFNSQAIQAELVEPSSDFELCCGPHSLYRPSTLMSYWRTIKNIAKIDSETRRLASLMASFAITAVSNKIFEVIDITVISYTLGSDNLAAYMVAGYFVGLSYECLKGFTDAQATLCAHAIGAGNYHLAGQYIQISQITFFAAGLPFVLIWGTCTYDALIWLDFDREIATIGQRWASIEVMACVLNGTNEAFFQFLSVADTEFYSNVVDVTMKASYTIGIIIHLFSNQDATLDEIACIKLGVVVIFFAINIIFLTWRGWLDLCWQGMMRTNAFKNHVAVKEILNTGLPLATGTLFRESEWGLLIAFASSMGSEEVATWAIFRKLLDIFAAPMEGVCCAAELRCAFHVGNGNQTMARISSYKSLVIGTMWGAVLITTFYFFFEAQMPKWLGLGLGIVDLVPLALLCTSVMFVGMLSWALVGAQGRYRLATLITILCEGLITVPLAAIFVYGCHFDLQGLVAAVTIGYSVSGTALMYLLLRSNWDKRIETIRRATSSVCEEKSIVSLVREDLAVRSFCSSPIADTEVLQDNEKTNGENPIICPPDSAIADLIIQIENEVHTSEYIRSNSDWL